MKLSPGKPGRHWGFYGVVMVAGWLAPPVAILIRFGVGLDLLICTILTIAGYFPGHAYNFYCQNIRNNHGRNRTPKWAIKAGLVKVEDPKSKPKHQWQNRYDERTPNRSEGYEDSATSSRTEDWDGHGPMPAPKGDPSSRVPGSSGGGKKKKKRNFLAPWEAEVSEDEVEGGAATVRSARPPVSSDYGPGPAGVGEEYYAPASQPSRYEGSSGLDRENSRLRTLVTGTTSARHRGDAGMSAPERGPSDRHARMNGARKRVEDPSSDRRNGVGYYDDGDVDPWSRSSENAAPKPAAKPADPLAHEF